MNFYDRIDKYPLHFVLGGSATDGGLEQNREELNELCKFISAKNIKTYLEIGCAKGYLLRFMKKEMNLIGLGITPEIQETHEGLYMLYGKSQDEKIINEIRNQKFDLIFVDGDHSYLSVAQDFSNYRANCKYMAFHDIAGLRDCEGVKKFWNEIKNKYDYTEFVFQGETRSGIGIIKI